MIVVIVIAPLAALIHKHGSIDQISSKKYLPLFNWMKKHGARLEPTFPGTDNESLLVFFELHTNKPIAEKDLEELRQLEGIDAAYIKGDESLPE